MIAAKHKVLAGAHFVYLLIRKSILLFVIGITAILLAKYEGKREELFSYMFFGYLLGIAAFITAISLSGSLAYLILVTIVNRTRDLYKEAKSYDDLLGANYRIIKSFR